MAVFLHVTLAVAVLTGLGSGQQQLLPPGRTMKAVGDTMKFITVNHPSPPFEEITWRFQGRPIITHLGGSNTFGPGYSDRVHLNSRTGSLELLNLILEDSGEYTVTIRLGGGMEFNGNTNLTVLVPVSVSLVANETELTEFRSTVKVTCAVSGSLFTTKFFGGSVNLTESYYNGMSGTETFSVQKMARRDMRPVICEASNDVTPVVVKHLAFKVFYGPDEATMVATPNAPFYRPGSDITLSCSSESSPAAQFQWALNGILLGNEGPELRLENIQTGQSGAYSCRANNSKTGRNVQSNTLHITVSAGSSEGAIAGIVIGSVLAVAALIIILLVVLGFRFKPTMGCYRKTSVRNDTL